MPIATATTASSPTPTLDFTATAVEQRNETLAAIQADIANEEKWPAILQEKFTSNSRNWNTGQSNDRMALEEMTISKNKYTWQITTKQSMGSFSYPDMATFKDGYASIDLQVTDSNQNDADQFGLIFHYTGNGWDELIPITSTELLKSAEVNHLAVSMTGEQIALMINGKVVDTLEDSRMVEGIAGVGINLPAPGEDATVIFSNFVVRAPK
jgi:hypothetical protein